ncbi:alpha/beta hydrolase, partial [Streptomyces sp. G44]|uniref:alpha/beta fold hydrolase n=1 Tax=Streptomyces sp. G44 TaxID=2807632 RepID=UPI0034D68338|nr:alpha/beta hydrolase [Streptomyces sp. G44]
MPPRAPRPGTAEDDYPDAPALVLIQGLTGSPDWWEPVVPVLARVHRVIRFDLAGRGRPGRSPGSDDGLPAHVRRVAAALDGLG